MIKRYFQKFFLRKAVRRKRRLLLITKAPFQLEESYKTLRTNLQFACADKDIKKIVVTSSAPGEGKTTVTINLAIALSQVGHKVLVLDLDMRKPKIHNYLKIQNFPGITNVLSNTSSLEYAIQEIEEHNISVITCGPIPPNPSELIQTNKMSSILEELGEQFDYIIMDTPPSSFITDAAVLSKSADGVLVVVQHGGVTFEILKNTLDNLKKAGANILGSVLNIVNTEKIGRYNYYKNNYYYKYYASYYDDLVKKKSK